MACLELIVTLCNCGTMRTTKSGMQFYFAIILPPNGSSVQVDCYPLCNSGTIITTKSGNAILLCNHSPNGVTVILNADFTAKQPVEDLR